MFQVFLIGFTSGYAIGFILECIWKRSQASPADKEKNKLICRAPKENEAVYKLILVVNMELKMGDGKIVAQCAHAAVGLYEMFYKSHRLNFDTWERQGKQIDVYKVSDTNALKVLYKSAVISSGLISLLVKDAGRTQIAAGSTTVLAIGPEVDSVLSTFTEYLSPYS